MKQQEFILQLNALHNSILVVKHNEDRIINIAIYRAINKLEENYIKSNCVLKKDQLFLHNITGAEYLIYNIFVNNHGNIACIFSKVPTDKVKTWTYERLLKIVKEIN